MTIKHLVALAATVGGLSFMNFARAADGHGASGDGDRGNLSVSQKPPATDGGAAAERLSKDFAQIEADFRQMQRDCDRGKYQKAQDDLERLVQHRCQYEHDKSLLSASGGDRPQEAATRSAPPSKHPGK